MSNKTNFLIIKAKLKNKVVFCVSEVIQSNNTQGHTHLQCLDSGEQLHSDVMELDGCGDGF